MPHTPPETLPVYVAHTPSKDNPHWHGLAAHALAVTDMAQTFAARFGGEALARYVGLLHDLGKFTPKFQQYLRQCHEAEQNGTQAPRRGCAPHKQHGARAALDALTVQEGEEAAKLVAVLIHGHHGGMKDRPGAQENMTAKGATSEAAQSLLAVARAADTRLAPAVPEPGTLLPARHTKDMWAAEMYLRFVFSALTDADALDTEAHDNPPQAARRDTPARSLPEMRDLLWVRQEKDFQGKHGVVNDVRRAVYAACVRAATAHGPGVFALTVPTGGGKTRSSLAFALEHAVCHNLRRVVYAIPYTSIVDQTAQVFRDIFGSADGTILEHHSAIDMRRGRADDEEGGNDGEQWRRLAAQNWDAPLVVTTTVQLFESLFSNKPGACRKLHRLAGSVIVLDEVQTLPPTLLAPLLSGLRALAENFGVTVVLCTATQPALTAQSEVLQGFTQVTPIVPEAEARAHFQLLRRVRYRIEAEPWTWAQVADEMWAGGDSCLCVVNTRGHALALLDVLDPNGDNPDVLHLSTLLCGAHRRRVLEEVRARLKDGPPVWVVSTQVIEAGVDVDFPKVLRAHGPLDRIIQAAGRCNREGTRPRDSSEVVVFAPAEDASPPGVYRMALKQTLQMFAAARARGEEIDFDDPALVTRYFADLYRNMASETDKYRVQDDRENFHYPDVARKMRLIDDDTISVFITEYDPDEAQRIMAAGRAIGRMTRDLWQRAQPLCVSIYASERAPIEETEYGLTIWRGPYDLKRGIPLTQDPADGVVYKPENLMA